MKIKCDDIYCGSWWAIWEGWVPNFDWCLVSGGLDSRWMVDFLGYLIFVEWWGRVLGGCWRGCYLFLFFVEGKGGSLFHWWCWATDCRSEYIMLPCILDAVGQVLWLKFQHFQLYSPLWVLHDDVLCGVGRWRPPEGVQIVSLKVSSLSSQRR